MNKDDLQAISELLDKKFNTINEKIDSLEAKMDKNHEEIMTQLHNNDAQNANNHLKIYESIKDLKKSVARVEVATADNWSDIAKLKAIK